jgi:hypothetical protein
MRKALLLCLMAILSGAGCISLSTFQTARAVEQGETEFGVAAYSISDYTLRTWDDDGDITESIIGGTMEASYRTGLGSNFDFGIKGYFIGAVIDGKYQFYDDERFDAAIDFGLGYQQLKDGDTEVTIVDLYPALLMTLGVSRHVDLTFTPKIIARFVSGPTEASTLVGGTIMLRVGPIMPEMGYYMLDGDHIKTFGVGIAR